jgi:diguanylate cyclase
MMLYMGRAGRTTSESARAEPLAGVPSFSLFMQPIRPLHSAVPPKRRLQGELLMRIIQDGSLHSPVDIIARRERDGTMLSLDLSVIQVAFGEIGTSVIGRICINISGLTISTPGFYGIVDDALRRTGTNPEAICFEITATAPITDMAEAAINVTRLHERGFAVALDDFQTGYSNEGYLRALPVDYIKISGTDIESLPYNTAAALKVARVGRIARRYSALTVAKCVSEHQQLRLLNIMGIDMAQGDFVGPTLSL